MARVSVSGLWAGIRRTTQLVTPTGKALLLLGLVALQLGFALAIIELRLMGAVALALLALAVPWLLVPSGVRARLLLSPPRAVAGEEVTGRITADHEWGLPLWQPLLRAASNGGETKRDGPKHEETWLRLPTLRSGRTQVATFPVRTQHRGVLRVGPVEHHLTDPLGLLRRPRTWVAPVELYVRPQIVAIDTLGAGRIHELEGVTSDRLSMNDLAFHALREYVRGDDLRHVHWRSSARAGQLLVRQYQESRRSLSTVVVDLAARSYGIEGASGRSDAFELAASIAASLLTCAAQESPVVSLFAGEEQHPERTAGDVLDALCRIDPVHSRRSDAGSALADDVASAVTLVPNTSLLLVVTGGEVDVETLGAALWATPADTEALVIRAVPDAEPGISVSHGHTVLTVGALGQLPALFRGAR
jgi:uncharacterized protein (DUF58 family)